MADFTSTGWRAGETVSAYAYSPTPPGGATGSVLGSDTASSSGGVTFTGLDTGEEYVAVGGTSARRIRFRVPLPEAAQSGSGLPDATGATAGQTIVLGTDGDAESAEWADAADGKVLKVFTQPLISPGSTVTSNNVFDICQRIPATFPWPSTWWEVEFRNCTQIGTPGTGVIDIPGIALGVTDFPDDGSRWEGGMSDSVEAVAAYSTPSDGSNIRSVRVTDPDSQFQGRVMHVVSIGTHTATSTSATVGGPGMAVRCDGGVTGTSATLASAQWNVDGNLFHNESTVYADYNQGYYDIRFRVGVMLPDGTRIILVLGDSKEIGALAGGADPLSVGMLPTHDVWPGQLMQRTGCPVVNVSQGGSNAYQWANRGVTRPAWWLDRFDLATNPPDEARLSPGSNDFLNNVDSPTLRADIKTICDELRDDYDVKSFRAATVPPRGFTSTKETNRLTYNEDISQVPMGLVGVDDIDFAVRDPASQADLDPQLDSGDNIHFNHRGAGRVAAIM